MILSDLYKKLSAIVFIMGLQRIYISEIMICWILYACICGTC